MKRQLAVIVIALLPALLPGAYQDRLSFLNDIPAFVRLETMVLNAENPDACLTAMEELRSDLESSVAFSKPQLQDWQLTSVRIKADTLVARYMLECPEKNSSLAKSLLKEAETLHKRLQSEIPSACSAILPALESDIRSIEYLASPFFNLSKGLEATKLIDKAYSENPEEVSVALMYANRRLYAPAIGGRNIPEAYDILKRLEAFGQLSPWDRFSVLSGIGMALKEQDKKSEAALYLQKARELYTGDKNIERTLSELLGGSI